MTAREKKEKKYEKLLQRQTLVNHRKYEKRPHLVNCLISKEIDFWARRSEDNGFRCISNIKLYLRKKRVRIQWKNMFSWQNLTLNNSILADQSLYAWIKGQINTYSTWTTEAGSIWHATARDHIKVYNFRASASSRLAIVTGNAYKRCWELWQ